MDDHWSWAHVTAIQMLNFPPRSFYDPGNYIVKQTDTIKSGATDGATWSDDSADLAFELQPGILYRVFASLIFQTVSVSGTPGVATRWKENSNITIFQLLDKGASGWNSSAVGQYNGSYPAYPYNKDLLAAGIQRSAGTVSVGLWFNNVWDGVVGCENAPTVLTPEWRFNSIAASGRTDFKAAVSWMWLRAEGTM
jgi:hypothetical protein